jgi:cytochrome b6-f complex iron-sulfur subunit
MKKPVKKKKTSAQYKIEAGNDRHPAEIPTRRSLLNWLWLALGGVVLAELAWVLVSFLKPLRTGANQPQSSDIVEAGPVERFAPNSITAFPRGRFYLACLEDGGFVALSRRCTHLGCTVPWDAGKKQFICPCHASVFDIRGDVVQSPAPRPLDRFKVTIENKRVIVDARSPIRRGGFQQTDVVYR